MARLAGPAGDLAHHPAIGVDLDFAGAGAAEQRIARQLLFRHRRDIAQHMRDGGAVGVVSDHALLDRNAGKFRDRDLDARHLLPG